MPILYFPALNLLVFISNIAGSQLSFLIISIMTGKNIVIFFAALVILWWLNYYKKVALIVMGGVVLILLERGVNLFQTPDLGSVIPILRLLKDIYLPTTLSFLFVIFLGSYQKKSIQDNINRYSKIFDTIFVSYFVFGFAELVHRILTKTQPFVDLSLHMRCLKYKIPNFSVKPDIDSYYWLNEFERCLNSSSLNSYKIFFDYDYIRKEALFAPFSDSVSVAAFAVCALFYFIQRGQLSRKKYDYILAVFALFMIHFTFNRLGLVFSFLLLLEFLRFSLFNKQITPALTMMGIFGFLLYFVNDLTVMSFFLPEIPTNIGHEIGGFNPAEYGGVLLMGLLIVTLYFQTVPIKYIKHTLYFGTFLLLLLIWKYDLMVANDFFEQAFKRDVESNFLRIFYNYNASVIVAVFFLIYNCLKLVFYNSNAKTQNVNKKRFQILIRVIFFMYFFTSATVSTHAISGYFIFSITLLTLYVISVLQQNTLEI